MNENAKHAAIRAYLEREFSGFSVSTERDPITDESSYVVAQGPERYQVLVASEVLDSQAASDLPQLLEEYNLAGVMRQLGDFRIIVTTNGCVFA